MRRLRFLALTACTLAALVAVAGAQVVTTPGGGAAMPVTIVGTADVNVLNWGGAALSIGQQLMAGSIPVTIASNQSALPVTFPALQNVNLTQWGSAATTFGQKAMAASVPVTMASDQPPIPIVNTGSIATPTTYQGLLWFQSPSITTALLELKFLTDYTAIAFTGAPAAGYWSVNRGQTWQVSTTPPSLQTPQSIAVSNLDPATVLLAGKTGAGAPPRVWRSVNGGSSWTQISLPAAGGIDYSCTVGIHNTTAIAFGYHIDRSTDSGATWVKQVDGGTLASCSSNFGNDMLWLPGNIWVGGASDKIIRSADDGLTWASVLAGGANGWRLTSPNPTAPAGTAVVYAIRAGGTAIYRSADSGATWSTVFTLPSNAGGINCPSTTVCVVSIASGTGVWRSLDAGLHWTYSGVMPLASGCGGAGGSCSMSSNTLGDMIAQTGNGGGVGQTAFSNVALAGQQQLIGPDGILIGTAGNPLRVDPTGTTPQPVTLTSTTANQGTAANSPAPWPMTPVQGPTLFNSQTTGAANTAVVVTIAAAASVRAHLYQSYAYCGAGGTSSLTVTDGGTTIWATQAAEIGIARFEKNWPIGLTGTTNSALVVTLATCGVRHHRNPARTGGQVLAWRETTEADRRS